jgi:hypothetical protein
MGLDKEEFWWRTLRFNWFGHQSRFDVPLPPAIELLPLSFMMFAPFVVWLAEQRHYQY